MQNRILLAVAPVILAGLVSYLVLGGQGKNIAGTPDSQRTATIAGKVVDKTTGAPIESARITVTDWGLRPGKPPDYGSAHTETDGSFLLKRGLPEGKYILSAAKQGYVEDNRDVTINVHDDLKLEFSLLRSASISGRVTDGNGKGVPGIVVGTWVAGFRYGRPWIMQRGICSTDDAGNYRIGGLKRGVYYIGTLTNLLRPHLGTPSVADSHVHSVYPRIFYSDGRSLAEAVGIPLEDEEQMTGIDLSMSQTKGYCVTASLPDLLVRSGEKLITSIAESGSHTELALGTGVVQATSHFYFCGVPSGDYILDAVVSPSERTTSLVGSEYVTVDKRNTTAETIQLEEPEELRGRIVVDKGQIIAQRPPSIGLELEPVERPPFADEDVYPQVGSDGRFTFHRLYSGRFWVSITSISPGYYVSGISAGPRDGLREPIQLGDGDLTITVRSDGPSISGIVTAENSGELSPSTTVVLMSETSPTAQGSIRSTHIDQTGRFSFDNLAPGKFGVIALVGINADDSENPSIIGRFSSQAKDLDLAPYSSQQIELHPIPAS